MLRSLHVKNLALIRETEVEFGEGLNIQTSYEMTLVSWARRCV